MEEIKPLTSSLEMIQGDATKPNLKLPLMLPCSRSSSSSPLLLLPKTLSFLSRFLFWFLCLQWKEKEKKWVFITCFLLVSQVSMFGFGIIEWKENEEKWF